MQTSDIALTNIKKGDIFYVNVNKTYYFLQIIHIERANEIEKKNGYFLVVFDKTFRCLPSSMNELDLKNIYQPKYLWKKTLLFTGIWNDEPNIIFRKDMMYYNLKDKYHLTYFGNTTVCKQLKPEISYDFSPQNECKLNDEGIQVTYQHLELQVLLWGIEQEEIGKTKRKLSVKPQYFKGWIEYVDSEKIIKTEKIIAKFENCSDPRMFSKELKKSILAINKLDDKKTFITTIEAENIIEKLSEIALSKGIDKTSIEQQIEETRTW
ncbi:hypothetical protein [uncultured Acetobacteroides sp.]|uniref:hypothetical protein n=1 Tax=uncultured Acetobacteroides sp. TaxID=1760811 RepID=UPI0029F5B5BB|nr:hypothetical protein [uncultured Acetobacteroides sp.]